MSKISRCAECVYFQASVGRKEQVQVAPLRPVSRVRVSASYCKLVQKLVRGMDAACAQGVKAS